MSDYSLPLPSGNTPLGNFQPPALPDSEFAGISAEVLALNVEWIEDLALDTASKEVLATPIADALGFRYTRFGPQAKGNQIAALFRQANGDVWQIKVFGENADGKTGQYLAPKSNGDVPYLPAIPPAVIQHQAALVSPDCESDWLTWHEQNPEGNCWEWLLQWPQIPLIITEGAKKALAAISQDHIALSLYGFACGRKGLSIKPSLFPYIHRRPVFIAFDQDNNAKTLAKVNRGIQQLATALQHHGKARVKILTWHRTLGKGLDDLIATDPQQFHIALATALDRDTWRLQQDFSLDDIVSVRINTPNLTQALLTLPDAKIIAIKSPKKTYKTEWLAQHIGPFLHRGGKVIVPLHREQLAREVAKRLGIEYRVEMTQEGKLFGYALCVDSLHPKARPPFIADHWAECWVILDEADQVLWHLFNSDTCQYQRAAILNSFAELCNYADKIFLTSADLNKVCIEAIQGLLTEPTVPYVIVNDYQHPRRPCILYRTAQESFAKMLDCIAAGQKVIAHSGGQQRKSKWGTINLEKWLKERFPDKKILRIDGDSIADPEHPAYGCLGNINAILPLYDVVLCSPTVETGVSINGDHFDAVFCFASGSQTVDAVGQTVERVRADVPRYIWVAENAGQNVIGNGSTSPRALRKGLVKSTQLNRALTEADNYAQIELDAQSNFITTWTKLAARHNIGFIHYRREVIQLLMDNGFDVRREDPTNCDSLKVEAKERAEANHAAYCEQVAEAPVVEDDDDYKALRNKRNKTEAERLSFHASTVSRRYATETLTPELVNQDSQQGWHGQLRLHYALTVGAPFTKRRDQDHIQKLAQETGQIFAPDFNKACFSAKVAAFNALNILDFLDEQRLFVKDDPELIAWHERVCSVAWDVKTYLGITVNPDPTAIGNSPIQVLKRFLKKLGLELQFVGKQTTFEQHRMYRIKSLNPDGRAAIFERWHLRDIAQTQGNTTALAQDVVRPMDNKNYSSPSPGETLQEGLNPKPLGTDRKNPVGSFIQGLGRDCQRLKEMGTAFIEQGVQSLSLPSSLPIPEGE